ncbi:MULTISPECIES: hypothetical protein, partial [unclassified Shinella]|uniref:hypothetical protein n=1 Tax=unclassified Shinella TaxID=2643062 RepID=UPI001AEBB2BE
LACGVAQPAKACLSSPKRPVLCIKAVSKAVKSVATLSQNSDFCGVAEIRRRTRTKLAETA